MTVVNERLESSESMPLRVGDVQVLRTELAQDRKGHEYTLRHVRVGDESDDDVELRNRHRLQGEYFELVLRGKPDWESTVAGHGKVHVPENNEAAQWLYYGEDGEPTQLLEWAAKFPTAIALEPLQRLEKGGKWFADGKSDDRSLELFTNMVDAIGLRSRARIYSQSLVEYAERSHAEELNILSIGSGAAVPNIDATKRLEENDKAVHWKFFDFDAQALMFAQELVGENNFKYSTFDYGPEWKNPDTNTIEPKGRSYFRAFEEKNESADIVDALGLWEYLDADQATKFAHRLFKKVKPGGSMIVSNMLPSRPQRQLNERAVGWQKLHLRNETDLLEIIDAAGIDTQQVTMTHAEDGVYVVVEIKKL